jgi:hypothetical protein
MKHSGVTGGLEVTADVFELAASIVLDQPENVFTLSRPTALVGP